MRSTRYINKVAIALIFGSVVFIGNSLAVLGQSETREYQEWQRAQTQAERQHQDYLRTRSSSDYRQWQEAERRAQEQYRQYQAAGSRYGQNNSYRNSDWNNNRNSNGRYRVRRGGAEYWTDSRGAELLRQAVRNGYSQGYQQGERDKRGRRPFDYTLGTTYRSGTYGYQSYVERNQYQYYFQQGFQRGYDDGYNNTSRYGSRSGNGFNILGNILNSILDIGN